MAGPLASPVVRLLLGSGLVVLGALVAYYARPLTNLEERIDAIGSTRSWSETEAAEWNVMLSRFMGVLVAVLGVGLALTGLLAL